MRTIDLVTILICKISFDCISLFIKVSGNSNNSFASSGLFLIQNLMTGQLLLFICCTDHVHIRNFDKIK